MKANIPRSLRSLSMSDRKKLTAIADTLLENGVIVPPAKALNREGYRKQSEGEWIDADPNGYLYRFTCSLCGKTKLGKGTPFCPNCGAKMKDGE